MVSEAPRSHRRGLVSRNLPAARPRQGLGGPYRQVPARPYRQEPGGPHHQDRPGPHPQHRGPGPGPGNNVALIDLLDRVLQGGIVIQGDITLTVADIDLVQVDLRLLVSAVDKLLGS